MRARKVAAAAAVLAAGALTVPVAAQAHSSGGPDAVGLYSSGTKLVSFDTDRPDRAKRGVSIRGLSGDTALVGIDRRVQNGKLYGVGNRGGIYTISSRNGHVTKVGQLSVALSGTNFGVDFNPAANALRVISDTGQNLRQPFGTTDGPTVATVVDGTLNYMAVTATGVTAAAYTNNDLNANTATTLFDIDTALDQVAIQSPANAGSLAPTGKLGVDAGSNAGFDIYSTLKKGKTVGATGFAVLNTHSTYALYSVDLLTGSVSQEGKFAYSVTDIAVDLDD
ncbi:MAG TPA: DUF4394 domain-containing protein [Propionibacteriaceae bacterium]|jgi:hypothetical protein